MQTREYKLTTEQGQFLFWYDRSCRVWVISRRDDNNNQIGDAMYAPTRALAIALAK